MDKYFEDIGRREDPPETLEQAGQRPLFHEIKDIAKTNRYKTIEMDDDQVEIQQDDEDDSKEKGLDWIMDPVENQKDEEEIIDGIQNVALEIVGTSLS